MKVLLAVPGLRLREILIYLLEAWDYSVVILEDSQDPLECLKKENPNLVIIDASFNDRHGLEICKNIKNDFLTSYIPTIVLLDKKQLRRDLLSIEQGVDDYLIKPPDPIDLEIRIVLALRSAAHHFNANALSKLPGNKLIKRELIERIDTKSDFSFHYIDIDNFKSYNDKYGHIRGDQVIIEAAKIISKSVKQYGSSDDFVGHIGGDDFVAVTLPLAAEAIARQIINDFDFTVPGFYSEQDRAAGLIVARDRQGEIANFPLMSLSIAIVNNTHARIANLFQLTDLTAELKKYLKSLPGSNYMVNRRVIDKGPVSRKKEAFSMWQKEG